MWPYAAAECWEEELLSFAKTQFVVLGGLASVSRQPPPNKNSLQDKSLRLGKPSVESRSRSSLSSMQNSNSLGALI